MLGARETRAPRRSSPCATAVRHGAISARCLRSYAIDTLMRPISFQAASAWRSRGGYWGIRRQQRPSVTLILPTIHCVLSRNRFGSKIAGFQRKEADLGTTYLVIPVDADRNLVVLRSCGVETLRNARCPKSRRTGGERLISANRLGWKNRFPP